MWDWAISDHLFSDVFGGGCDIFADDFKHSAYLCCYSQSFFTESFLLFFQSLPQFSMMFIFFPGVGRPCTQIFPVQWKYPTEVRARPLILRLCRTHCEQKITDVLGGLSSVKTTIYFIFVSIQFWYFIVQGITSRFALQILQETNFRQHIFTAKT